MIFGYNCLRIPDKGAFTAHLKALKPPAILLYNTELDFARQLKAQFPAMEVIMRNWPDKDVHKTLTPQQWLDKRGGEAAGGLTLYTTNESGIDDKLINWHISLMRLCIPLKIKLCIVNQYTGGWDINDMPRLRPLLELAGQHPDLFTLGLHTYCGGIITSGVRGGNPDDAGVIPGTPGGLDLTKRDNWKQVSATDTFFHIGRHKMILEYCQKQGITPPKIGITEIGFDSTGDIGSWLQAIGNRTGHQSINGWHTLTDYWRTIFPDWSAEMAYVEQFLWAQDVLLKGAAWALFYAYGDDGNWPNYNVQNSAIPALLEAKVRVTQESPAIPPIAPPIVIPPVVIVPVTPVTPPQSDAAAIHAELQATLLIVQQVRATINDEMTAALKLLDDSESKLKAMLASAA